MVKLIKGESDLATLHPDLVKEWHPIKNGDLMSEDISSGSGKEVWWLCPEGHTYSMVGIMQIFPRFQNKSLIATFSVARIHSSVGPNDFRTSWVS